MRLKHLFASALLFFSAGAWAQTDVTSTYLTNADFSQTTALTGTYLYGYGKDGSPYGFQAVDGWTFVVTAGDNSNNSYPNSGLAGGVFSYGSSTQLKGNAKAAPATNPDGEASGNCLGFFGVWGCGGYYYQNVTLAAGKYTITVPMYSQSGTQANTTYTGFFPTSGTNRTVAVNPTVEQWVNQTVTFTLTDETAGQIRIGYQSTGSGSGANPMLFIDCVKIEFTATVVKDVLSTALSAATTANTVLNNSDLAAAIATAQAVYDHEDSTQDEVNAAAATLNAATELAMSATGDVTGLFLSNPGFESSTETTTNAAAGANAAPVDIAGGWTQVSSAAWSSSAVVAYGGTGQVNGASAPSADNAGNGGNTLGVSVGWGGLVTYQSAAVTLPAGVYTLQVNAYNNLSGVTQFASKFGFVPTAGSATLSTKNVFTYAAWETDKVTFTLNEATEGKIQVGGQAISGGSGSNAKVFFDNITITYKSFLAGAKAAYDEAKAAAEAAVANTDYENVTGSELTALQAEITKAEPTTVDGYNEAAAALNSATQTFTAAKAAYDGLAALWNAGVPELKYATTEKYTAIGDAYFGEGDVVDAADAAARTVAMKTAIRAYYESHALAEKVEGAVNCADAIAGADPDTNAGWTGGIGVDNRANEKYTDAAGNVSGKYYDGGWSTSAGVNINMSREMNLPAGTYLLTVTARGSVNLTSYTMSVGGETVDLPGKGSDANQGVFGHGWDDASVEFTSDGHPVTLTITATSEAKEQWVSFNRFRLMCLELNTSVYADADDYAALNSAISAAEGKTLGFYGGEYAPSNNVAALEALAIAKSIDQTAEFTNLKSDVTAATQALSDAQWSINNSGVDIIYNGMFATVAEGKNYPEGWTRTNAWGQMRSEIEGDYATAYYNQPGSLQYGNQGVYTMPLRGNQYYRLTFSYRSHENNSNQGVTASVLNAEDGLAAVTFTANGSTSEWKTVMANFKTGAAGNYVLTLANNGNTWITNVSMTSFGKKEQNAYFDEDLGMDEAFGEVYHTKVTTWRGFTQDKWCTFVVPFDITNEELVEAYGEGVEVAEFSENSENADEIIVNFTQMETPAITANKPVLLKYKKETTAGDFFDFTNKLVRVCEEEQAKVEGTFIDFAGVYNYTDPGVCEQPFVIPAGHYFISNDAVYRSNGSTTIKPFRAYLQDKTGGLASVKMFISGIETGIEAIENGQLTIDNGAIFNIAGQRVQKAQKGLYIVNGKKVMIK